MHEAETSKHLYLHVLVQYLKKNHQLRKDHQAAVRAKKKRKKKHPSTITYTDSTIMKCLEDLVSD